MFRHYDRLGELRPTLLCHVLVTIVAVAASAATAVATVARGELGVHIVACVQCACSVLSCVQVLWPVLLECNWGGKLPARGYQEEAGYH